jgi:hypothetical protein
MECYNTQNGVTEEFIMDGATKRTKVTIKIPRPLYDNIKSVIEGTGFDSPTDFIVYILRDVVSYRSAADSDELKKDEIQMIRKRLKSLGYM